MSMSLSDYSHQSNYGLIDARDRKSTSRWKKRDDRSRNARQRDQIDDRYRTKISAVTMTDVGK